MIDNSNMKKARFSAWLVPGLLLALFLWITSTIVRVGSHNPIVYIAWGKAEDNWTHAEYPKAVSETLRASWMTIDCGLRITMSKPFFLQSSILEKQGQPGKAIDVCKIGARLIGQYDLEGGYMYGCDELEIRYHILLSGSHSPTSAPTTEP